MDDDSGRWEMEWMITAIDVGLGDSFNWEILFVVVVVLLLLLLLLEATACVCVSPFLFSHLLSDRSHSVRLDVYSISDIRSMKTETVRWCPHYYKL